MDIDALDSWTDAAEKPERCFKGGSFSGSSCDSSVRAMSTTVNLGRASCEAGLMLRAGACIRVAWMIVFLKTLTLDGVNNIQQIIYIHSFEIQYFVSEPSLIATYDTELSPGELPDTTKPITMPTLNFVITIRGVPFTITFGDVLTFCKVHVAFTAARAFVRQLSERRYNESLWVIMEIMLLVEQGALWPLIMWMTLGYLYDFVFA